MSWWFTVGGSKVNEELQRVWDVVKHRSYIKAKYVSQVLPITSQKAARLLKKIEFLGFIEVFKQRKAGKVWKNLRVDDG